MLKIENNKNCNIKINDSTISTLSAKEMFERLGYGIDEENDLEKLYKMKWEITSSYFVDFDKTKKTVECFTTSDSPFTPYAPFKMDMYLLQAINQEIEELGWNK